MSSKVTVLGTRGSVPVSGAEFVKYGAATFASPWDITPYLDGFAVSDSDNAKLRCVANGSVRTINIAAVLNTIKPGPMRIRFF